MTAIIEQVATTAWHPEADIVANLDFCDEHERLTIRRDGVGSSDIAKILGESRWGTPRDVWEDKTGRSPIDLTMSEAAEWGQTLEPVIARKFAERHGCQPTRLPFVFARRDKPWHQASPDYGVDFYNRPTLVEIKCRDQFGWDQVPDDIYDQVQWQLHVTGLTDAYVVVLFRGREMPPPWPIRRDPQRIAHLVAKVDTFWGHVRLDEPPPPMAPDTKRITPSVDQLIADAAMVEQITHLDDLKTAAATAKAAVDEAADLIRVALADHNELVDSDGNTLATYRQSKTGRRSLNIKKPRR